ncbi:ice-binding family protein [Luteolibacter arcticus]|uniref:Ice-binding family protein n=1 Tax=Luteolibacter arcticus TaxID=1581411 RepID=A0ABT3GH49_9BACT|nr:ice-binding family protein [Luteolibacter arcticus]MCW1922936.1 ice-binding family protein [Luteolibacter arcticus]
MINFKSRDDNPTHTYGSRLCAKVRLTLHGLVLAMVVAVPCGTLVAANPVPVDLGTSANFGALAGGAISGTGHVKGDVGSGTGAIAPAITSAGTIYPTGHAAATTALTDFATAYNDGKNRTPDVLLSAAAYELGGTTLKAGVHKIGAAATLASSVTLNAEGNPDAVFIIQIAGAFGATASVGNVVLANDARSKNVFWVVEGAVSMGAGTHMEGNILGGAAITFGATTTINGRALAGSPAGTITLATTVSVPVEPSVVGDRVWFDSNGNGIQEPAESTGFSNVPVTLMQMVLESLTIDLGTAANFGALSGGAISGSGNVAGNVGSGTGAIAPAITSTGTIYPTGHAVAMTALADFATAYNDGKNRTPDFLLSAAAYELGGTTLTPGVHKIGAAATLASSVTLDAQGDPEAVFIVQITGAFGTTASVGNVVLINDAKSANVFWIVEGAVSIGANSHMEGNILGGAAVTFGASTTISGRALAGSAAGTVAFATTVSAVTGTPPVGNPPPIVVANTVTDANGNYLFGNVQPGTYFVRWDLSGITNDFRTTTAEQGSDQALDSDSASGEVGGLVNGTEIEVLGGTTHLGVDLGLVETLPAIKAAAINELAPALVTYLLANYYSAENWAALQAAKTDGEIAIQAATDAAGVATAKNAALAAMDAVPTYAETLAAAKAPALNDLATALASYLETDYTAGNWTMLNDAKTNGTVAIDAATDPAGVATARNAALAAMDAVPTIAETLAVAKAAAMSDLATTLATYLEASYYTAEKWTMLTTAKTNGEIAINAATDLAGVTAAKDMALAAMQAAAETLRITDISRTAEGEVTLVISTTPNIPLTLQTSTDLKIWATIATPTPSTGSWTFVHDAELATGASRFYRAFTSP